MRLGCLGLASKFSNLFVAQVGFRGKVKGLQWEVSGIGDSRWMRKGY